MALEVEIRPLALVDIAGIADMDHGYHTDYVWQMDVQSADGQVNVQFRQVHLPRSMRVDYPRDARRLADDWKKRSATLVADKDDEAVGYVSLMLGMAPNSAWVTDLAVARRFRRQGVGSRLLLAAQAWAQTQEVGQVVVEMQSKNYPGIRLAGKLGYEFCGYSDRYYANQDIALFFSKRI